MMKYRKYFFSRNNQRGGMLVELMMTIALAAIIIPFVFRYQQTAVNRARNVAITKQMENVQTALERYIVENKTELMKPMGKNITSKSSSSGKNDNASVRTRRLISTSQFVHNSRCSAFNVFNVPSSGRASPETGNSV